MWLAWGLFSLMSAAPPAALSCAGPFVPPNDYDLKGNPIQMEFAVAVQKAGTPVDGLDAAARSLLIKRLCRLDDSACATLAAKAKVWQRGQSKDQQCAMAVIGAPDIEAWRNQLAPDLNAAINTALKSLLPDAGGKKERAIVMLGDVNDMGAPGGVRATWLVQRLKAGLTALAIDGRDPPKGFNGHLPRDVQYLLRASMIERVDPRNQLPVVEMTLSVQNSAGNERTAAPFAVPAALAPNAPRAVEAAGPAIGLQLHVDTRSGGSLCPGDFTQIHVTNETADPMYVRVFNVDDNGEVLVLFPNETIADDAIPAGKTIALQPDGFSIDGSANGRERYIVIGAKDPGGLGAFQAAQGTCRYPTAEAKRLASGTTIRGPYRATTGFTLLDDVRCQKVIATPDPRLVKQALDTLPLCK
jgi:hypothetical protein